MIANCLWGIHLISLLKERGLASASEQLIHVGQTFIFRTFYFIFDPFSLLGFFVQPFFIVIFLVQTLSKVDHSVLLKVITDVKSKQEEKICLYSALANNKAYPITGAEGSLQGLLCIENSPESPHYSSARNAAVCLSGLNSTVKCLPEKGFILSSPQTSQVTFNNSYNQGENRSPPHFPGQKEPQDPLDLPILLKPWKITLAAIFKRNNCSFILLPSFPFLLLNYDGDTEFNIPGFSNLEFLGSPGSGTLRLVGLTQQKTVHERVSQSNTFQLCKLHSVSSLRTFVACRHVETSELQTNMTTNTAELRGKLDS